MRQAELAAPVKAGSALFDDLGHIDPEYSLQVTGSFTLSQLSRKALASKYARESLQEYKDLLGTAWQVTGVETAKALQGEAGREVAALRAKRVIISKGQAFAVRIERLFKHLDSQGKHATALVMAQALRGDDSKLKSLQRADSKLYEYAEFFAILAELQCLKVALSEYLQLVEAAPLPKHLTPCTLPEFIKPPKLVLRGSVSIAAPPAVPADITHMGYAVGLVA
jgi:hypothetical protein